ncbi:MAG: ATP-binding protein, partial [Infirmifilum sp.]
FSSLLGVGLSRATLLEWVVQEHLYRRFGEVFYYRNNYEIDAIAGSMRVEVKTSKARRRYPAGTIILKEDEIPEFLINLYREPEKDKDKT